MALSGDTGSVQLFGRQITADEAEQAILAFLRVRKGEPIRQWTMLNALARHFDWEEMRKEKRFLLLQLDRLVKERKVIRYRKGTLRGKIRIHEGYV